MTSPKAVFKSVGPKLVPFFKTVSIYFVLFIPISTPSWLGVLVKCLPIISLCIFVLLHGMNLSDEYAFSRRILTGLVFSCIGDAFLIFPQYFIHGMMSFAVAQVIMLIGVWFVSICQLGLWCGFFFNIKVYGSVVRKSGCLISYTSAFGFHPFNPHAGAVCLAIGIAMFTVLLPGLQGIMTLLVAIYEILLLTMVWRAIARVQFFEELWTWTKLCSCAGGIIFMISDGLIGFHHFHSPIPHSQALIMITYYAAQLGIALSVVDSRATSTITSSSTNKINKVNKINKTNKINRKELMVN